VKNLPKCKKCGIEINEDEIKHKLSSGYRCDQCHKFVEKEKKEWGNLYDYLKEKYFIKIVPTTIIKELKETRKDFNYETILNCFKSIENNLLKYYQQKEFNNDYQRSKYIMSVLRSNIDGFFKKQLKNNKEEENIKHMDDFEFFKNKKEYIPSENYDILD